MSRRIVCETCGGPVEARRSTRRFCSALCRVRAARTLISVTPETPVAPVPTRAISAAPALPLAPRGANGEGLPSRVEVRHVPGSRMANGDFSGRGGRTTYVVDGRSFDTPRAAIDFATR